MCFWPARYEHYWMLQRLSWDDPDLKYSTSPAHQIHRCGFTMYCTHECSETLPMGYITGFLCCLGADDGIYRRCRYVRCWQRPLSQSYTLMMMSSGWRTRDTDVKYDDEDRNLQCFWLGDSRVSWAPILNIGSPTSSSDPYTQQLIERGYNKIFRYLFQVLPRQCFYTIENWSQEIPSSHRNQLSQSRNMDLKCSILIIQ